MNSMSFEADPHTDQKQSLILSVRNPTDCLASKFQLTLEDDLNLICI